MLIQPRLTILSGIMEARGIFESGRSHQRELEPISRLREDGGQTIR